MPHVPAQIDTFAQFVQLLTAELSRDPDDADRVVKFAENVLGHDEREVHVLRAAEWSHVLRGAAPTGGLSFVTVWPSHVRADAHDLGARVVSVRDLARVGVVCARVVADLADD